jgi:DNA-binding NarL/FixJ family response regulator
MKKKTVAFYGHNLVLSSIGAYLQNCPDFQVVSFEETPETCLRNGNTACPEVIFFDLAAKSSHFPVSLMCRHPEITLIGIDLTSHQMLVLSGESSRLLTIEDLLTAIEKKPVAKDCSS